MSYWVGTLALLVGCGARTGLLAPETQPLARDAAADASKLGCPDAGATLVYLVSEDNQLVSFDPPSATFSTIGHLDCPSPTSPFSMAVDRHGTAYVEFADGTIFRVSTADATCQPTSFVANQSPFNQFGMGYATIGAGPTEQLFIASSDGTLGMIDPTSSFELTTIGPIQPKFQRAELTGTGDGRLFAFVAPGTTGGSSIVELDKTSGKVLAEDSLPNVDQGTGWAFAFWGGDFWLFTTPGQQTTLHYDPKTKNSTVVAHYGSSIVGAGVSTCAPE